MSVARAAGIPAPGVAAKLLWALAAAASKDFLALAEAAADSFAFWSFAFWSWVVGFSSAILGQPFNSCPESIAQFVLPTQTQNRYL
jgi:hypothetical protein